MKIATSTNSYFNGQRNSKGRGEITPHLSPLAKASFFSNQVQICARLETQLQPIKQYSLNQMKSIFYPSHPFFSYHYHAFLALTYFVFIEALASSRTMVTYDKVGGMQEAIAYSNQLHPCLPFHIFIIWTENVLIIYHF